MSKLHNGNGTMLISRDEHDSIVRTDVLISTAPTKVSGTAIIHCMTTDLPIGGTLADMRNIA